MLPSQKMRQLHIFKTRSVVGPSYPADDGFWDLVLSYLVGKTLIYLIVEYLDP